MVPFEQNSFSKATQIMLQTERARKKLLQEAIAGQDSSEDEKINDELDQFLFDNCMTVQEQMFPLVRFWEHLFRHDVNMHPGEINAEALTDFVHMFKQGR